MRKLMSKKGFTLVELMIVIVIMGILVAVAIPVYGAVTKNAEKKTCISNMRDMKSMASTYQMQGGTGGAQIAVPAAGTTITSDPNYEKMFDGGKLPSCPSEGKYTVNIKNDSGIYTYEVSCTKNDLGHKLDAGTTDKPAGGEGAGA